MPPTAQSSDLAPAAGDAAPTSSRPLSDEIEAKPRNQHGERPACFKNTFQEVAFVFMATLALAANNFVVGATVVVTASIGRDLDMTQSEISWISAAVSLTAGAFQLALGQLADLLGRKAVFLSGMGFFSGAALIVAFAQNPFWMDILCGVLGLASAMMVPPAIGILGAAYTVPSRRKNWAFACFSAGNPLGFAAGSLVCGIATRIADWRAGFVVLAIIWAVLGVASVWVVPGGVEAFEPAPFGVRLRLALERFDSLGTMLTIVGVGMVTAALTLGPSDGWKSPHVLAMIIVGFFLLVAFVFWENYVSHPLMPLHIWKDKTFTLLVLTTILGMMAFFSSNFWLALLLQNVQHKDALDVAVHLLPQVIAGLIWNVVAAAILHRVPNKVIMAFGALCYVGANLLLALQSATSIYWAFIFPSLLLNVVGADFHFNVTNMYVMQALPIHQQSLAGGIFNMLIRLGSTISIGISTAVFSSVKATQAEGADPMVPYQMAFFVSVGMAGVSCLFVPFLRIGTQGNAPKEEAASEELTLSSVANGEDEKNTYGTTEKRPTNADLHLGSMSADTYGFTAANLPQDPFFPQDAPTGPVFLDTQACLCALQKQPESTSKKIAWQCIGNQTLGVYDTTQGKWFNAQHDSGAVDLPVNDDSNGPNTNKSQIWDSGSRSLKPLPSNNDLAIWEKVCTGVNHTTFSTSYYRALDQLARNDTPIDAAPCWRPGAIPLQIQDVEAWQSDGCPEGFLCQNNTVNSLPQYCPPIAECQMARLAGTVCQFEGKNIGMGPFEPVICQRGWYCPPASNGTETFICPSGTYCQPGAATPTPCSIGSACPEGSFMQVFWVPLLLLFLIDVMLVGGIVFVSIRHRFQARSKSHATSSKKVYGGMSGVKATITGYKTLPDENEQPDQEMVPMNATYTPGQQDGWTGFEAALDMQSIYEGHERDDSSFTPQLRIFVESMRKATDATNFGLSFGYSDLNFHPKGVKNPILQNVTGSIDRGSLVAVMGGSGAGKSTFVNVLMGKTKHTGGMVSVNNVPGKMQRYKKMTGYVPQDDIVLPELTVYENIAHSARIRLPRSWEEADIEAHVESVIDCLELSHVHDSLVGSVGKPVISGGQRKRVSIGMELAAAPMAIFLDEPTSGLDATAASSIMRTLKAIARLGISIIVIIHQPRSEIWELFDKLILLGNGQTIYEGAQRDVQHHFESIGFHFPDHCNNGDVVTDIVTGNGREYKKSGDISKEALTAHWETCYKANSDESQKRNTLSAAGNSSMHQALKKRGARRHKQIWLCLRRSLLQQYRAKGAFWSEMGLATVAGFLLGLAENEKKGVLFTGFLKGDFGILSIATDFKSAPELALLIAIAIGLISGAPGVKSFSEELLLHRREAEAGHSRIAYFLAKVVSVLPRMLLGCMHFSTIILLLSGPIIPWGIAFLANLLYFYCIYGLASCISMVARREDAPLFATMISLVVAILSGASPPLSQVKTWHLEWLWRASPGVWLAEVYFGQLVRPFKDLYDVELASTFTGYHLDWMWQNLAILFAIGTVYRVLAYIGMYLATKMRRYSSESTLFKETNQQSTRRSGTQYAPASVNELPQDFVSQQLPPLHRSWASRIARSLDGNSSWYEATYQIATVFRGADIDAGEGSDRGGRCPACVPPHDLRVHGLNDESQQRYGKGGIRLSNGTSKPCIVTCFKRTSHCHLPADGAEHGAEPETVVESYCSLEFDALNHNVESCCHKAIAVEVRY
ncbi:hypothetical protein G7046_g3524 [Stylonectria norvegica]|nr:hypothetical protein G7046_g3524 [Stylonectria norvegica]